METRDPKALQIWNQRQVPVVVRRAHTGPLIVQLPFRDDNRVWLRGERRSRPRWDAAGKYWSVPASWFDYVIRTSLERYGRVYAIQGSREQQRCAPACWNAEGFDCECSCLGENHGNGRPDGNWHEVSDTFAFQWGPRRYACRLIRRQ